MKLIISILLFPTILIVLLAFGCFAFYRYGLSSPLFSGSTSESHTLKAFMYMAIGAGLPLSIICTLSGSVLTVLSFLFKSWTRAALSIGIAAAGVYFWMFFMEPPFPFD